MSEPCFQLSPARLRCTISALNRLLGRKYKGSPLWSLVSDVFGHGSTESTNICRLAGLNPCQPCGGNELHDL